MRAAEQLLKSDDSIDVTPANRLLTRQYAAEALCSLNRPAQAAEILDPNLSAGEEEALEEKSNPYSSPEAAVSPYSTQEAAPVLCRPLLYTNVANVFISKVG